jgi:LuxR family transcriptional regulator, maltose regulon positive regulatory protein
MADRLLQTKLRLPPLRPSLLPRPHLWQKLKLGPAGRLILLSAPTGYGKTTLVAGWLAATKRPFGWLSLDENDNDPARFLHYLIAALQQIEAGIGHTAQVLLQSPQSPPETVLTSLINDLAAGSMSAVLVLDDYHLITGSRIHQAVTFLLDNLPATICLVLISRTEPPLPLARLRVRAQLTEIRQTDLRFGNQEIVAFFHNYCGLDLTPDQAATLAARTEGWAAALQLAAVSWPGCVDFERFAAEFGGRHRHVVDYLASEVLRQQPAVIQHFLRATAVLDRFTAPLCDALLDRHDSQQRLAYLEQNNLLLTPLDERREWYRYHPLLAEFLHNELSPEERIVLQRRAARWFAAQKLLPEAIEYALAAQDEDAAGLIVQAAPTTLLRGEHATLRRWLAALPTDLIRAHGELSLYQGWLLFQAGKIAAATTAARRAEAALSSEEAPLAYGRLRCLQAWLALHQQAAEAVVRLAGEAIDLVAGRDDAFHVLALTALGEAHEALGETAAAVDVYRQAVAVSRQLARPVVTLLALVHLAITLNECGRRQEAVALCRQVVEGKDQGWQHIRPFSDALYLVGGWLSYEANELTRAGEQVAQGLRVWQQLGVEGALLFGRHVLAQVQRAGGDLDAARQTARAVRRQAAGQKAANYVAWAEAFLQEIWLWQGKITAVAHWVEQTSLTPTERPQPWQTAAHLLLARLLLAQNRPGEALTLLNNLAREAQRGGRGRTLMITHLLQAVAYAAQGEEARALTCGQQALTLAAAEGYVRVFLEEGEPVRDWLQRLRPRLDDSIARQFSGRLLHQWDTQPAGQTDTLIEPLTEREMEVLQLLVDGRSNPEIAEALFVSLNTVKWHVKNIYGKLQVSNRVEAAARAQEHRLAGFADQSVPSV